MVVGLALTFGLVIGLLLGMVGGGGSILTVPILVYALDLSVHEATATSLVIVGATAVIGVVPQARGGRVTFKTALPFGAFARRVDEARLARGFATLVALVGIYLIARNSGALL